MRLSVVIPTLNEAAALPATLDHVAAIPEVTEVLVSDGGSTDATERLARARGVQWVTGARGRGAQLRRGAERATGDVILLLHADTWLPPDAGAAITVALNDPALPPTPAPAPTPSSTTPPTITAAPDRIRLPVVGGGFHKTFRDAPWLLRSTARWRSAAYFRLTGRLFGDQALFVRRETLLRIGGVPDLPLMEEFALCRELRKHGRLALARATVSTSARTFQQRGVLGTWWLMARIQWQWQRGVPPEVLAAQYRTPPRSQPRPTPIDRP